MELPSRILNISHKKELLRGLWVNHLGVSFRELVRSGLRIGRRADPRHYRPRSGFAVLEFPLLGFWVFVGFHRDTGFRGVSIVCFRCFNRALLVGPLQGFHRCDKYCLEFGV